MSEIIVKRPSDELFRSWFQQRNGKSVPFFTMFELTSMCNFRCCHCYFNDYKIQNSNCEKELSFSEITNIIDQICSEGGCAMSFTGGECLIRKDFAEIYRYAYQKGFSLSLLTNASLIDPKLVTLWEEFKPRLISISYYGDSDETYEKITGNGKNRQKVQKGVELLKSAEIPFVLKSVVLTLNVSEISEMQTWASKQTDVDFVIDPLIRPTNMGDSTVLKYRLTAEQAADVTCRFMRPSQIETYSYRLSQSNEYKISELSKGELDTRLIRCRRDTISAATISPFGKLNLCGGLAEPNYDLRLGTIAEGYAALYKYNLRKISLRSIECVLCGYSPVCNSCTATSKLEEGDIEKKNSFRCRVAKLIARKVGMEHIAEEYTSRLHALWQQQNLSEKLMLEVG